MGPHAVGPPAHAGSSAARTCVRAAGTWPQLPTPWGWRPVSLGFTRPIQEMLERQCVHTCDYMHTCAHDREADLTWTAPCWAACPFLDALLSLPLPVLVMAREARPHPSRPEAVAGSPPPGPGVTADTSCGSVSGAAPAGGLQPGHFLSWCPWDLSLHSWPSVSRFHGWADH